MRERRANREAWYAKARDQAERPRQRLYIACDYLRAACSRLSARQIDDMIEILEELARKAGELSDSQ